MPAISGRQHRPRLRPEGTSSQKGGLGMPWTMYLYQVVREYPDGSQGKRTKQLCRYKPDLKVGGLYTHLGRGFPGMQRVIRLEERTCPGPEQEEMR